MSGYLGHLTLGELRQLQSRLKTMVVAGDVLDASGIGLIFDLTPGAPMVIRLDARMPAGGINARTPIGAASEPVVVVAPDEVDADDGTDDDIFLIDPDTGWTARDPDPQSFPVRAQILAVPAGKDEGGGVGDTAAAPSHDVSDVAAPLAGGDNGGALPAPPAPAENPAGGGYAVPSPGGDLPRAGDAGALQKPAPALRWTPQEDARAIDIAVENIRAGGNFFRAAGVVAQALGRTEQAAAFRINRRLKHQIRFRLSDLPAPEVDPALSKPAAPVPPQVDAAASVGAGVPRPAPVATDDADPLTRHLTPLQNRDGFTPGDDLQLLELADLGWKIGEISVEMNWNARALQRRFDRLTGLDADAKTRAWPRADLLAWYRQHGAG